MHRVSVALLALAGFAATAAAAPPANPAPPVDPDPKSLAVPPEELSKARALVQKLGSESYADREEAQADLAAMGRSARAALLDGFNLDPDPEIRARCRTLLPKATNEEMKARLASFKADVDNKYDHDLPGWHKLRACVRGEWTMFGWKYTARPDADKAARALFIDFMEAPGGRQVLAAVGHGDPAALGQLISTRRQEMYTAKYPRVPGVPPRNPSVAEVGAVVFAESQVHSRHVPRSVAITTVLSTSGLPSMLLGSDDKALAMKAVMNAWFDSRTDGTELYTAFNLATQMNNNDAVGRLATKLMTTAGVPGYYKGQALSTLVRLKMNDQIPAIEKAFTDTTVLTTTIKIVDGKQVRQSITVGDASLLAALVMTGQEPSDYGYDAVPKNVTGGTFSYVWAKIDEGKRKEAVEKWNKWREKNP